MIVIGRDAINSRLEISANGKVSCFGNPGSVPMNVSRQHISLTPDGKGGFTLQNMNPKNVTYVNNTSVVSKHVTPNDRVELGASRYLLPWHAFIQQPAATVNTRHLQQIWDNYERKKLELEKSQGRFNAIRGAAGVVTMLAIGCGFLFGHDLPYLIMYGIAILLSIIFAIIAYIKASKLPEQRNNLNKTFQRQYVCPKCGKFLGFQDYHILMQKGKCPYCNSIFV